MQRSDAEPPHDVTPMVVTDHQGAWAHGGANRTSCAKSQRNPTLRRTAALGLRTLVDPTNPKDVEEVHKLQDAIKVSQNSPGRFEVPEWDQASRKKVHDALLVLGETDLDTKRMFGDRGDVDPVRHLIGTARTRLVHSN